MSAPLRWRVGDVTVTRIVESGGASAPLFASVPPTFLFSNLSTEDVQAQAWLQPHFATAAGRLIASIHAFVVESRGKTIVVDTCVGNDKVRDLPAWTRLSGPFLADFAAWAGWDWALLVWIPLTWALFQHTLSGLRHLVMDIGAGYELPVNKFWSTMTLAGSVVLTAALWAWLIFGRAA